jgi:hypothetical protein
MNVPFPGLAAALALWGAATLQILSAATYYVDSQTGADTQPGTALDQAWQSLERVNQAVFQAGDQILFKAGTHYSGQLKPQGSGRLDGERPGPIVVGKYGPGPRPRLDGEGRFLDTVLLRNLEFWEVQDLEITNLGPERQPFQTGVRVVAEGVGKLRHLHLQRLYVHDVNGDLRKDQEGCGIFLESRGRGAHFDDLRVEDCHVVRTDRNGICQRSGSRARSLRVVIRGNLLEDIGGDGIKTWGCDGALVEHNILRGGRTRCADYAAGIWPWDCDDTLIQFNEVSEMKGTKDGQGFDADYRCRRSVFQYNYSHDNEGGFMLICAPASSYCEDTVIRYNVSQNDGLNSARVFHFAGASRNTRIYNNTIYVGPGQDLPLLLFTAWDGGEATNTCFFNNLFYVAGRATYRWGGSRDNVFANNLFFGGHVGPPADPQAITNQPPLIAPGQATTGLAAANAYGLRAAAAFMAGRKVPDNGGRDFAGHPVRADPGPGIGAFEFQADRRPDQGETGR